MMILLFFILFLILFVKITEPLSTKIAQWIEQKRIEREQEIERLQHEFRSKCITEIISKMKK